ncbi:MAG: hypothetical protein NT018_10605 [Armatimonadetes bacterium]|nr:hypothetical protein [Armatimonadota bacterium]
MSWDRPPIITQRAHDIAQVHVTEAAAAILERKRADASERMRRDKIRQERERKRRNFERHEHDQLGKEPPNDEETRLDVVV